MSCGSARTAHLIIKLYNINQEHYVRLGEFRWLGWLWLPSDPVPVVLYAGFGAPVDFLRSAKLPALVMDGFSLLLSTLQVAILERKTPLDHVFSRLQVGDTPAHIGDPCLPPCLAPHGRSHPLLETDLFCHRAVSCVR